MVDIKFHGVLGEECKTNWRLDVKSVGEAMRAINILTRGKLFKFLYDNDKKGLKYNVLINNKIFEAEKPLKPENIEDIKNSELCINHRNLRNIDVIPIIEGTADSSGILGIIIGVILIIIGILMIIGTLGGGTPLGVAFIIGGIGFIAAGVINLLTSPPHFDDYREIGGNRRSSFLFDGPQNTVKEGVPVPIGYGELLVGSAVVSATYEITDIPSDPHWITS